MFRTLPILAAALLVAAGRATAQSVGQPVPDAQTPAQSSGGISVSFGQYGFVDPFHPLPFETPISRTRFAVQVLDETSDCAHLWGRFSCPRVVMPDGTERGMGLSNYTYSGPRSVLVERIEYPPHVSVADAPSVYHVAVGG